MLYICTQVKPIKFKVMTEEKKNQYNGIFQQFSEEVVKSSNGEEWGWSDEFQYMSNVIQFIFDKGVENGLISEDEYDDFEEHVKEEFDDYLFSSYVEYD